MLLMEGGDLVLVGTAPGTMKNNNNNNNNDGTLTKAHGQTYTTRSHSVVTPTKPLQQTYTTGQPDSGRVNRLFEENGRGRVISNDKKKMGQGHRTVLARQEKRKKKHNPSYVDDTLFGSKPVTSAWPSQWEEKPKTKTYVLGATDVSYSPDKYITPTRGQSTYKLGSQTERPGSSKGHLASKTGSRESRPGSARSLRPSSSQSINKSLKRQPIKIKHTPSYVDDMLFGSQLAEPEFDPPWKNKKEPKAFNFDYTNYKSGSTTPSGRESASHHQPQALDSSRISRSQSTAPGSRPPSAQKPRHNASYVDDSLFGPKLAEPGWSAPWEDHEDRNKQINIYDAFEHKVTIHHDDVAMVRPKSSVSMVRKKPPSAAKPAWR